MPARTRLGVLCAVLTATGLLAGSTLSWGQDLPPSPSTFVPATQPVPFQGGIPTPAASAMPASLLIPPPDKDGTADPVPVQSNTSFIDSANVWNLLRFRFDAAYDMNRPTRNEYFITASGPQNRGLPVPERRIDYQELSVYCEYALLPQFSLFVEMPERLLNPDFNSNQVGPGDLSVGGKLLAIQTHDFTGTGQLTATWPTGVSTLGLGTSHTRLEGGILTNWRPTDFLIVESSFKVWVPIDDSSYGGEMLIYGIGVSYANPSLEGFWATPVLEFTGWTCIRGAEQVVYSATSFINKPSEGDTIVNGNLGVRAGLGQRADLYLGYSRSLTGERWYKDLYRVEVRWRY